MAHSFFLCKASLDNLTNRLDKTEAISRFYQHSAPTAWPGRLICRSLHGKVFLSQRVNGMSHCPAYRLNQLHVMPSSFLIDDMISELVDSTALRLRSDCCITVILSANLGRATISAFHHSSSSPHVPIQEIPQNPYCSVSFCAVMDAEVRPRRLLPLNR